MNSTKEKIDSFEQAVSFITNFHFFNEKTKNEECKNQYIRLIKTYVESGLFTKEEVDIYKRGVLSIDEEAITLIDSIEINEVYFTINQYGEDYSHYIKIGGESIGDLRKYELEVDVSHKDELHRSGTYRIFKSTLKDYKVKGFMIL